jgi:hypothetical protein
MVKAGNQRLWRRMEKGQEEDSWSIEHEVD